MKKVLIITYYWPPSGGGGVQRWLQLTRHIQSMGWSPIVYAPENPDYPLVDESLVRQVSEGVEVIRRPIIEPRRWYRSFVGGGDQRREEADEVLFRDPSSRGWKNNLAVWLRGNLFVPDARVLWVKPSVRFLAEFLSSRPVDVIVSTGPPHSMHLIARTLKERTGIPWIADFRDPWTDIEYHEHLMLSKSAHRKHQRLERSVIENSDVVVTVSPTWRSRLSTIGGRIEFIPNGFDEQDFSQNRVTPDKKFTLLHTGTLSLDRNPETLWRVLSDMGRRNPDFASDLKVRLVGKTDPGILNSASRAGLLDAIDHVAYVSHPEAIKMTKQAQVLLLIINKAVANAPGRIPGKLFEYLASQRPVLVIGPTGGDAAAIVASCRAGTSVEPADETGLRDIITKMYEQFQRGRLRVESADYLAYSRSRQAKQFVRLFNEVSRQ